MRMPYGEPRPVRPEFFGHPPQTSAPTASAPAGYPAHLHHRRPVTPPKAGRARSPSQHRRRRKGDSPAGPDRVAERRRKFVRLKFVLLKFVLLKSILLKPLPRLNLHGLQMLRLHPLLSGMRKQYFSLCCKAAETSYPASCTKPLGIMMLQHFSRMDCQPFKPTCCLSSTTWRTI